MQDQKIVYLNKYRKFHRLRKLKEKITNFKWSKKMLFLVIATSLVLGSIIWHFLVEYPARLDVQIPASDNVTYNHEDPIGINVLELEAELNASEGKPVLLFIYTTWCSSCLKQFPIVNEVVREFQNTDLKVITVAIDRDINSDLLKKHVASFGDVYFQPKYLSFKEGLKDLLKRKNINYTGRIPYTVLISQYGEVVEKYVGAKSPNYLRNKIIREVF